MKLYAVTVATHNEGYFDALIKSCKNNDIDLVVLGFGDKWQGYSFKFLLMKRLLDTLQNDNDILIFLDAFDVIATQHSSVIKKRFLEMDTDILISTEQKCGAYLIEYGRRRAFGDVKVQINSGCYMGYVGALKQMFSYICQKYHCYKPEFSNLNDQYLLTSICNDNNVFLKHLRIKYDTSSYIFYTIKLPQTFIEFVTRTHKFRLESEDTYVKSNRLYIFETNMSPCFVHGNGNVNMDDLTHLYHLPSPSKKRSMYMFNALLHFSSFFKIELFVISVFITVCVVYINNYNRKNKYTHSVIMFQR